ncbi:MAG: low molecular weight protein-tyrosine-phosphatase [Janthinobacterium lividum]
MLQNLLIVCTGNICRSPMGMAILQRLLPAVTVTSAGTNALIGAQADPLAVELIQQHGLDLTMHRGKQIDADTARRADLILVMEKYHKVFIESRYVFAQGKTFLIRPEDLPDPYMRGIHAFQEAYAVLEESMDQWAKKLAQIS